MAIEVLPEISSAGISPRISFSHDLNQKDDAESIEEHHHHHHHHHHHQRRLDASLLDSGSDFDFCFVNSFVQELSSADELFSNGKILPVEIKKRPVVAKQVDRESKPVPSPPQKTTRATTTTAADNTGKKRLKEFLSMSIDADDKPASKSFWQFKRSSSLNCESTRSKSLIRSLHFLSRSNSTGSAPNPKPTMLSKETQRQQQHLQKQPSLSRKSSVSSSSSGSFYSNSNSTQKPPLKKNCGAYGHGVRVSPVLHLPHPFISNATVGFFGITSLFCNGKVKKKKR